MTIRSHIVYAAVLITAMPLIAQEPPADMTVEPPVETTEQPKAPTNVVNDSVEDSTPNPELPVAEQRIRAGILLLSRLSHCMSAINDKDSADAAVPVVMVLHADFNNWIQSFNSLPKTSQEEVESLTTIYLPIIKKANAAIHNQANRLHSANYYGSELLPAALSKLVLINQ